MSYAKAVRYATKLMFSERYKSSLTPSPKDLVHDAYLKWSSAKQSDLFSQELGTVFAVIKNVHFNNISKKYIRRGTRQDWKDGVGVKLQKGFVYLDDEDTHFELSTKPNQESNLIAEEYYSGVRKRLSTLDNNILQLRLDGYKCMEIEDKLSVSNPTVTKAINRIKQMLQNPFNGNKTKVTKRLSRSAFDKNPKYAEEYEMGDNSDHNEYYTLMTSKLNPDEGLLIKEVKD